MILELTTVEDVELYPEIGKNLNDADRYWILQLIRGVSRQIENYTGRMFRYEQRVRYLSSNGTNEFVALPAYGGETDTIDAVFEDIDRVYSGDTQLAASDYWFDSRTGFLYKEASYWSLGIGHIKVVWTAGFGTTPQTVPEDLKMAATMQVVFWFQRRKELGLQSKSTDGGEVQIFSPSTLLPTVEAILQPYKMYTYGLS